MFVGIARADNPIYTLFDGKSLEGWHQAGPGSFDLHDGMITANGGMGLLWNDKPFGDFIARVEFKTEKKEDNSGVFVRFPDPGNDPWIAVNKGHEIQICDTENHNHTGAIYNFQDSTSEPTKPVGQWNLMEIKVVGLHYTVTLNGQVINDFTSTRSVRGYIGLQNHFSAVSFRKVTVEALPGGADPLVGGDPEQVIDPKPGLVGEYFTDIYNVKTLDAVKSDPIYVCTDPAISFAPTTGAFNGSHLIHNFGVVWAGDIHIDRPGSYHFSLRSEGNSKLVISEQTVISPARNRGWTDRAGDIAFASAGDYPIKLLFAPHDPSPCILSWQPPGAEKLDVVPESVLSHARSAEGVKWNKADFELFSANHRAWLRIHGHLYEKMDYGPFLSGTFKALDSISNITLKGIIVSLNQDRTTNILFDTELLRYSAGWTGGYIDFHGVAYDGAHGVTPQIEGKQIFGTPSMPGWEHNGSWKDPRHIPYGPLPQEWGHFRGLYRCGDQVVLSYTVDGIGVLDLPGLTKDGSDVYFTRTLQIDPSPQPLKMLVTKGTAYVEGSDGAEISNDDHQQVFATFPPHNATMQYTIRVSEATEVSHLPPRLSNPNIDFNKLMSGGPARWGKPLITQGKLGEGNGPYVVDTLTAPDKNPSDAWLRFGGFDFFPDGHSAAICTWNGDVWIVKGIDDKLDHLTWKRYATGLFQALGLKIVNGEIYVLGRDQITRLHDLNGDGEADFYENFNNDIQVTPGFHEFAHDLQVDSQGNFFFAKGGPVSPGGNGFEKQSDDNGCIMKLSPDGKKLEVYATGLRAPNGMSIGPDDRMTVSDNQGTWVPACRISFVTQGAFLGVPDTSHMTPKPTNYGNPICWFPYVDGDYTQGDNSSGGAAWDTFGKWGPMDGKIIHLSYGTCSIFETMTENINGIWQGGTVRFPLDFDSGIMRARFNPIDGQLYVAGLKGWQTRATKDGIFQRVRYTGKPVNMPSELHVLKDGLAITFKSPLKPDIATDTGNYNIEQWNYIWSGNYGSPDVTRDNPKKKGHDTVDVDSIELSADQKTITMKIDDLKPVMQMKIVMKIQAADGTPMNWELDNTINVVPGRKPIAVAQPVLH